MGPSKVDRYGADLIALCRGDAPQRHLAGTCHPERSAAQPKDPDTLQTTRAFEASQPRLHLSASTTTTSAVHPNQRPAPPPPPPNLTPTQLALETRLKDWRREAAKAAGLPTFFIFSDTVLRSIALAAPTNLEALRTVRGIAPDKIDSFGATILSLCRA